MYSNVAVVVQLLIILLCYFPLRSTPFPAKCCAQLAMIYCKIQYSSSRVVVAEPP